MKKPIIIGICGGTGSGKTTVANKITENIDKKNVSIIHQDAYYKFQNMSYEKRCLTNYDHPFAFDTDLLLNHINCLIKREQVQMPIYDFSIHNRTEETKLIEPKDIIIIEGILIFEDKRLRDLMDIKIFVDTDADIRIIRRITRDINERSRTLDSVIKQYISSVKPAHEQFIEPLKKYADLIIPEGGYNTVAIDVLTKNIKYMLKDL